MANKQRILEALSSYAGDMDTLNRFVQIAQAELGDDWVLSIYTEMGNIPSSLKEKLDHAYNYYAALTSWNEIQSYLTSNTPLNRQEIEERIPILSHWLSFFGDPGMEVIKQLQIKLEQGSSLNSISQDNLLNSQLQENQTNSKEEFSQADTFNIEEKTFSDSQAVVFSDNEEKLEPEGSPSTSVELDMNQTSKEKTEEQEEKDFRKEKILSVETSDEFAIRHAFDTLDFIKRVQAWTAARCIALGNIEVFSYKYYGFLVDAMEQGKNQIRNILSNPSLYPLLEKKYENGLQILQDNLLSLEEDLRIAYANAQSDVSPLVREDLNAEEAKKALGVLDTSNTKEYLGPAPDGFEVLEDPYEELDETQLKKEYDQLEAKSSELDTIVPMKKSEEGSKISSQSTQNSVQKKMSFSFGSKGSPLTKKTN